MSAQQQTFWTSPCYT